jgi:hypothetical protein
MDFGRRFIPVAPTADPAWFVFDASRDDTTVWAIPANDDDSGGDAP